MTEERPRRPLKILPGDIMRCIRDPKRLKLLMLIPMMKFIRRHKLLNKVQQVQAYMTNHSEILRKAFFGLSLLLLFLLKRWIYNPFKTLIRRFFKLVALMVTASAVAFSGYASSLK